MKEVISRTSAQMWRLVLFVCGILAVLFSIFLLYMLVQLASQLLIARNGRGNLFLELSELVGLFSFFSYVFISAGLYLAKRIKSSRVSPDIAVNQLTNYSSNGTGVMLQRLRRVSRLQEFQPLMKLVLLFGLGCSVTLYGVHMFLAGGVDTENLGYGKVNERPLLPSDPSLFFAFKNTRSGILDVVGVRGSDFDVAKPDSAMLLRLTASIFAEENKNGALKIVEVIGYADASGADKLNQRLSRERAETIRNLLIAAGVPEAIISMRAAGVRNPACTPGNTPPTSLCLQDGSRRTEVYFWHAENLLNN